ncbi:cell division protein ZapD [Sulfuriferula plumbiphila]|uniref:Cell division protein ZapD n=1 Tax=Sulfuriferula plumbiphila TaxID=171865 RepID=A0A512L4Y0_9PROT|nr:cell division protein ZapD [Sulfuriferula plumbiphila]BBP03250.1 cell division protein ZapD [Sulfuriferula plumbiphila]GEP29537.1 cell division protein ZapD [Sulfuriferula plumbiphila]
MICYEYPLSERVRTLLRLEDMFDKVRYFAAQEDSQQHHAALLALFEILEVASRADLKSDLLQELERQRQGLELLRSNPAISEQRLNQVLAEIARCMANIHGIPGKLGQHLRDNEWLMAIKQRTNIPGGACEFDLPAYHYWLHLPVVRRQDEIGEWLTPMLPIYDGLSVVLKLLRESGKPTHHIAFAGAYQQMLAGKSAQMLRINLRRELPCAPEISANKYALNIRFMSLGKGRPRLCESDIEFELTFCNL